MAAPFRDLFSRGAAAYARHRPVYPEALYAHVAKLAPARDRAWDCATGSAQAARGLAGHFREVIATDASPAMTALTRARSRERIGRAPRPKGRRSGSAPSTIARAPMATGLASGPLRVDLA